MKTDLKVIISANQKGGAGKSTLIKELAVEVERAGDGPVWLIDTDKQGTLTKWHTLRQHDTPQLAETTLAQLERDLDIIRGRGGAYCFIDTAPTVSDQTDDLMDLADLILIPCEPSPADAWAVGPTIAAAREAGKPFLFVMTKVKPNTKLTAQTVASLSKHGTVAESFLSNRVNYAASMTSGSTAPELEPRGPAAMEVSNLWQQVKSSIHESNKSFRSVKHG